MSPAKAKKSKITEDQEWKCSDRKEAKPKSRKIHKNQLRELVKIRFSQKMSTRPKRCAYKKTHQISSCIDPNDMLCIICLETLIYPTTLECGHTFCLGCIETYHKKDTINRCCLCRNVDNLDFYESNSAIQKIIYLLYKREACDSSEQYRKRKEGIDKNMKERGVFKELRENDELKIKVKNGWERAKVTKVQNCGPKTYYSLTTILKEQQYLISSLSKNLMLCENKQQQMRKQANQDIFIDERLMADYMHQNIYNLDEFMWPDSLEANSHEQPINLRQNLHPSQNSINGIEVISVDDGLDLSSWMEIPLMRRRVLAPQIIEID